MAKSSTDERKGRLTKTNVDKALPETERYTVWDSDTPGFGVRVAPTGRKVYVVRYRAGAGRTGVRRQMVIGVHGAVTADQARKEAERILARVMSGEDPQAEIAAKRAELTVSELCDQYAAWAPKSGKKASTLKIDRFRIDRHIKPLLGHMKLSEVTKAKVETFVRKVADGDLPAAGEAKDRTRGGKGAAARSAGLLGGIFSYAKDNGLVAENPVHGVARPKDTKRERYLTTEELSKLSAVLEELAQPDPMRMIGQVVTLDHVRVIRLLLLTGARKNEVVRLRWSEVDIDGGYLRLADSKTGARVVPLTAGAASTLVEIEKRGDWVFPDAQDRSRPLSNLNYAWEVICGKAGLQGVRIHDLRHTFARVAVSGGASLPLICAVLGHRHASTTQRYAHLQDSPVKAAAARAAEQIQAAMSKGSAEVISLRRGVK